MSATIYIHEVRTRLRSVVIWSLSVAAIIFIFFSIFPGFASQAAVIDQMMARFPPALLEAFGMNRTSLASVLGFYSFIFVFVQLCLAIQAGNYGFGLVSVEENELTADFLLTRPVSRSQVLTSKLLAALTSLTMTNAVVWVFTFVSISMFHDSFSYETGSIYLLLASIVIFQLFFLSVGLVISLLVKRVRSVTPYSLGLGFGMYVLAEENKRGVTIFFSSHVLSEVQALCRRVAIVKDGRIIKSDEITALRDKQLKKVRVLFSDESPRQELNIKGIESFQAESAKSIVFMFSGDINELIQRLSVLRIENLSIEEPPLEEIFLHYYR